jgi:hypothetical protein
MSFMVKSRENIRNTKSGSDGIFYLKQSHITHHSIPQIITGFVNSAHHPVPQKERKLDLSPSSDEKVND